MKEVWKQEYQDALWNDLLCVMAEVRFETDTNYWAEVRFETDTNYWKSPLK